MNDLSSITRAFSSALQSFKPGPAVKYIYNPLDYALGPHLSYVEKFGSAPKKAVFLGMNPGPWGMAQTGVPFGEINTVNEYLQISGQVGQPAEVHPAKEIAGFAVKRSEVSGKRLWGAVQNRYPDPAAFFKENYIYNYCPLMFLDEKGRNITPDKLKKGEQNELYRICDLYLQKTADYFQAEVIVAIGAFAEKRAKQALQGRISIIRILHPSPASPAANRGWYEQAAEQLQSAGYPVL